MGATQRHARRARDDERADNESIEYGALTATQFLRRTRAEHGQAVALDVAKGFVLAAAAILARELGGELAAEFLQTVMITTETHAG